MVDGVERNKNDSNIDWIDQDVERETIFKKKKETNHLRLLVAI